MQTALAPARSIPAWNAEMSGKYRVTFLASGVGDGVAGVEHGVGVVGAVGERDRAVEPAAVLVPPVRHDLNFHPRGAELLGVGERVLPLSRAELGGVDAVHAARQHRVPGGVVGGEDDAEPDVEVEVAGVAVVPVEDQRRVRPVNGHSCGSAYFSAKSGSWAGRAAGARSGRWVCGAR